MGKEDRWNRFADLGRAMLVGGSVIAPIWRRDFRSGLNALTAVLAASAASKGIKAFWSEPRPNGHDNNSFPSLHSADCFAAAAALSRKWPNGVGPAAIGLATAVALARVFAASIIWRIRSPGPASGLSRGNFSRITGRRCPSPNDNNRS